MRLDADGLGPENVESELGVGVQGDLSAVILLNGGLELKNAKASQMRKRPSLNAENIYHYVDVNGLMFWNSAAVLQTSSRMSDANSCYN